MVVPCKLFLSGIITSLKSPAQYFITMWRFLSQDQVEIDERKR